MLPAGYLLGRNGISRAAGDSVVEVCPCVILPARRVRNHQNHEESLRLCWFEQDRWRFLQVRRSDALDNKKIVQLADFGFPVSSVNAKEVVRFHHACIAVNQANLQTESVSDQLGWVQRLRLSFA